MCHWNTQHFPVFFMAFVYHVTSNTNWRSCWFQLSNFWFRALMAPVIAWVCDSTKRITWKPWWLKRWIGLDFCSDWNHQSWLCWLFETSRNKKYSKTVACFSGQNPVVWLSQVLDGGRCAEKNKRMCHKLRTSVALTVGICSRADLQKKEIVRTMAAPGRQY